MTTVHGNPIVVNPDLGRDEVYLLNVDHIRATYTSLLLSYPARCVYIDGITTNEDEDMTMDVGL